MLQQLPFFEMGAGLALILYFAMVLRVFLRLKRDVVLRRVVGKESQEDWEDLCWKMAAWWPVVPVTKKILRKLSKSKSAVVAVNLAK